MGGLDLADFGLPGAERGGHRDSLHGNESGLPSIGVGLITPASRVEGLEAHKNLQHEHGRLQGLINAIRPCFPEKSISYTHTSARSFRSGGITSHRPSTLYRTPFAISAYTLPLGL